MSPLTGKRNPPREPCIWQDHSGVVALLCSECLTPIRDIQYGAKLCTLRAYYCERCDPGYLVLNIPTDAFVAPPHL